VTEELLKEWTFRLSEQQIADKVANAFINDGKFRGAVISRILRDHKDELVGAVKKEYEVNGNLWNKQILDHGASRAKAEKLRIHARLSNAADALISDAVKKSLPIWFSNDKIENMVVKILRGGVHKAFARRARDWVDKWKPALVKGLDDDEARWEELRPRIQQVIGSHGNAISVEEAILIALDHDFPGKSALAIGESIIRDPLKKLADLVAEPSFLPQDMAD